MKHEWLYGMKLVGHMEITGKHLYKRVNANTSLKIRPDYRSKNLCTVFLEYYNHSQPGHRWEKAVVSTIDADAITTVLNKMQKQLQRFINGEKEISPHQHNIDLLKTLFME